MQRATITTLIAGMALVGTTAGGASAVMAPHNETNAIACTDCHDMEAWGGDPQLQLGGAFLRPCPRCHNNTSGGGYDRDNAPAVQTHAAAVIGSTRYGDWAMACNDCHGHKLDTAPIATGSFLSYADDSTTTTTIVLEPGYQVNDPDWSDFTTWSAKRGPERGLILALRYLGSDGRYQVRSFEITDAFTDAQGNATLVVKGVVGNLADGTPPDGTFEIFYSMMVKEVASKLATDPNTGEVLTADFRGPHTFAVDESGTGVDPTPTGICQVCHTQTQHWRSDGSHADNHFSGEDCTQCHDHRKGFKPRCDLCHGEPPVVAQPDPDYCIQDSEGANIGLVCKPGPTGSQTAGQHQLHATSAGYGFDCTTCHFNGMPATPVLGNDKIQIGFDVNGLSGQGTHYDGQVGVAYEGTNGTTVSNNGTMVCSNVYCHSQAKRLLTEIQDGDLPSVSPAWDGSSTDADGFSCNNCHGYPPTFDAHTYHFSRGFTCSTCHYGTTVSNTSIADKTLHANGRYDVIPGLGFYWGKEWHELDFVYTFAPDGGTCSENRCHQFIHFQDPKQWVNRPQRITVANFQVTQGQCTGGTPTAPLASSTVAVNVSVSCRDCVAPYNCDFDWGDGSVETNVPCTTTHTYADAVPSIDQGDGSYKPDPTGNVIGAFQVKWTVRDSFNVPLDAGIVSQRVEVCGLANVPPVPAKNLSLGPDPATYDVILTDLSVDPDYDLGAHWDPNGVIPGTIHIDWGDGTSFEGPIVLTDTPSNQQFSHTYPRRSTWWIRHGVKDNASDGEWVWSPLVQFKVERN